MKSQIRLNAKTACRYGLFLLFSILTINCMLWDLGGEEVAHDVFSGTYTKISQEQTALQREVEEDNARDTEWADYNNAYATNQAATYQAILSATVSPPSPPVIERIEFLSVIIGDGQTNYGSLYFHDTDGDVNRLTLVVVSATNFGGADYDPNTYLIAGDYYAGVYQLYIWCEGSQDVTLRATLYDLTGLKSNSVDFSFTCE
jgi:hypothetical protein